MYHDLPGAGFVAVTAVAARPFTPFANFTVDFNILARFHYQAARLDVPKVRLVCKETRFNIQLAGIARVLVPIRL